MWQMQDGTIKKCDWGKVYMLHKLAVRFGHNVAHSEVRRLLMQAYMTDSPWTKN